ncbi:AMP-binding protein [Luteimonas sp. MC1750]|uniref:AMP-binding protein n=1 Tax=Luteimonas sp. MC1750 TaxID=2799326 RepID=UPI0018F0C815|nr:AMP-binding protein [Luteimonas sp. MC1750]MBJ6985112.1 acyl-CoA synthetase [Luteimonas sp. MC1750]QQO05768.1 acyl-CoA synthetase [Luteimonas sp. MC1750]
MSAVISINGRQDAGGTRSPLVSGSPDRPLAFGAAGGVALQDFLADVRGVAALLPDRPFAVNLCEDRYRFLVAFAAAAVRGQVTLLPPSRTRAAIDEVRAHHPDSYCLGDADACGCEDIAPLPHYLRLPDLLPRGEGGVPDVADDAVVAIGYTSGSTGAPKANLKTWGSFAASTAQNIAALDGLLPGDGGTAHVVATVPPQHMYGMEMSVLLPLVGGVAVHEARPFFPVDIAAALAAAPLPPLLVTTPVHLRALVESGVALPPLAGIVASTAPLPPALAAAAEAAFGCEVRELFGSTETCILARRRSALDDAWTLLPGVELQPQPDGTLVRAAHLAEAVALADIVELVGGGRFRLRGRQSDLLEIAGKRASLGDLTHRLLAIPGVRDAALVQLEPDACGVRRLAAAVVAPGMSESAVREALRQAVDPVFLPRPLRVVGSLPRNETGKLPRKALLELLSAL